MKIKLVKKLTSIVLGVLLCTAFTYTTASADVFLDMINKGGHLCSLAQRQYADAGNKIIEKINYDNRGNSSSNPTSSTSMPNITITYKPTLEMFGVYSYIETGKVHNEPGEDVSRKNLPLCALVYLQGRGDIVGVKVDDKPLSEACLSDKTAMADDNNVDTACCQVLFIDKDITDGLKNGMHTITVYGGDRSDKISTSYFTFNLVD